MKSRESVSVSSLSQRRFFSISGSLLIKQDMTVPVMRLALQILARVISSCYEPPYSCFMCQSRDKQAILSIVGPAESLI